MTQKQLKKCAPAPNKKQWCPNDITRAKDGQRLIKYKINELRIFDTNKHSKNPYIHPKTGLFLPASGIPVENLTWIRFLADVPSYFETLYLNKKKRKPVNECLGFAFIRRCYDPGAASEGPRDSQRIPEEPGGARS